MNHRNSALGQRKIEILTSSHADGKRERCVEAGRWQDGGIDDDLTVNNQLSIPMSELTYRFSAAGGPGGQHANRNRNRVELVFDIAGSTALNDDQRRRLLDKLGERVSVVAADERSQLRNRVIAQERLAELLRSALRRPRPRRATTPTRGSQRRRLDAKSRRGEIKRDRRRPSRDD